MTTSLKMLEAFKKLLVEGSASTQENLKQSLTNLGFHVNQAKISRLLRKLGAIKVSNEKGQVVYCLPKEPAPLLAKSPLSNLVIDIKCNESLIVIHTSPGSASLFGRLIDHHLSRLNVLGTIAGDDTVLVVPESTQLIEVVLGHIQELLTTL